MPTVLDSALAYIDRGWCPIPIPFREKGPKLPEWGKLRLTRSTVGEHFNGHPQNIGVLLGEPSGWLVDVDLDCDEARRIAPRLFPSTAVFGRRSSRHSHFLYHCAGAESCKYSLRTPDGQTHTLLEIRSTNLQTVFPPSTHKDTGESIEWANDCLPTTIDAETLGDAALEAAIRSAFARFAPGALDSDATAEDGYPIDRLPDGIREQVSAWISPSPTCISPPTGGRIPVGVSTSYAEAVRRYNSDHRQDYPRSGGQCPMCGHKDCFGRFPEDQQRWACFSASHDSGGIHGPTCWHGDQLDIDVTADGKTRTAMLRDTGYLVDTRGADCPTCPPMDDDIPPPMDEPDEPGVNERAIVIYTKGRVDLAIASTLPVLADRSSIYVRGDKLVTVTSGGKIQDGILREELSPSIFTISRGRLLEMICSVIEWKKFDGRSNNITTCEPPPPVIESILNRGEWPCVPRLNGIATTPILREDGTLCVTPGFDVDTGIYYVPRCRIPELCARPVLEDAQRACAEIFDVVCDFNFASPAGRSAWLSTILARIGWSAFRGGAPMAMIDATTPGTGKSLLADVSSMISTGCLAARSPWVKDSDEFRKRVLAHLMAGDQIALIDNVPSGTNVGWDGFDAALTAGMWKDRELGRSANINVAMDTLWMCTGNNIGVRGDGGRRTLRILLECDCERPEERDGFLHNPLLPWIAHERPRLLAGALTILRAYILAGKPNPGIVAFGSFDGWSDLIRGAIVWCGEADPGEAKANKDEEADETGMAHSALLASWHKLSPNGLGLKTIDIIDALLSDNMGILAEIKDAISVLCPMRDKNGYNSRSLGKALKAISGRHRTVDGKKMQLVGSIQRHVMLWRVVEG